MILINKLLNSSSPSSCPYPGLLYNLLTCLGLRGAAGNENGDKGYKRGSCKVTAREAHHQSSSFPPPANRALPHSSFFHQLSPSYNLIIPWHWKLDRFVVRSNRQIMLILPSCSGQEFEGFLALKKEKREEDDQPVVLKEADDLAARTFHLTPNVYPLNDRLQSSHIDVICRTEIPLNCLFPSTILNLYIFCYYIMVNSTALIK